MKKIKGIFLYILMLFFLIMLGFSIDTMVKSLAFILSK